jgi:hypothetical protein
MTKQHKNQHEWGVVAQQHSPYKEYSYCPLCRKYRDSDGNIYTRTQFIRITQLQRIFEPDSTRRLTFKGSVV